MRVRERRAALPLALALGAGLVPLALPGADATPLAPALADLLGASPLGAEITVARTAGSLVTPGTPLEVSGRLGRPVVVDDSAALTPVAGRYSLQVRLPGGEVRGPFGPYATGPAGQISAVLPASATQGITAADVAGERAVVAVEVVDAVSGARSAKRVGATAVPLAAAVVQGLQLDNSFVSAVGWVKPGDTYPARAIVRNTGTVARSGAVVTIEPADGMRFTKVSPTSGGGSASISGGRVTWQVGTVPAAGEVGPGIANLVMEARADSVAQDPQIVWKNLSTTGTLRLGSATSPSTSHGPKVIPPDELYDTARYGDRPFPVVPVEYVEREHAATNEAELLDRVINSPTEPGSTFNLFQEMSFGQLHPNGTVPSSGIATADFSHEFTNPRYADGFDFTNVAPGQTCVLATDFTLSDVPTAVGSPAYPERIKDGWYQLPGTTGYYGRDAFGSALVGAFSGQGALQQIDSGCGPTGKAVYDAAHAADPEIDYSDYDTDKDGIVDFFMMIYAGRGGHGDSQLPGPNCPADPMDCSYDNIWPHSSSLEFSYTDTATGQTGYISDDQLKDPSGRLLYYTNESRSTMTTTVTDVPVYVRVGPYNVNPESAIDKASVISHEYGHSLGLPDFYSIAANRETYGDWNLMATDKSQHMDVFAKQDMGWVVPRVLKPGAQTIKGWQDGKVNTHRIDWVTPSGQPYSLTGPSVANGEAYTAKVPGRTVIDPKKVEDSASPSKLWWSKAGNDFGCAPEKGHNLDIALPELADVEAGTPITVTFKSYWDIEWDYDYGFVLLGATGENGAYAYTSVPSEKGYTTPVAQNPNANSCQARYGNGITGTSASYSAGTQVVDRVQGSYDVTGPFLEDSYDISSLAGKGGVLRFSYATDPGLARPGWFVDDLVVKAGDDVIFSTDFTDSGQPSDPRVYNGGCKDATKVANSCTSGWAYISSDQASTADRGYYLEMRDRSGFDESGRGENDRAAIGFEPGVLLTWTDETGGYGNTGQGDADTPNQSPLDAAPEPGNVTPKLNDAAFNAGEKFDDSDHVDNYRQAESESGNWEFRFGCLSFAVKTMTGDDDGPDPVGAGGDVMKGDVDFTLGEGCAKFNYGHAVPGAPGPNVAPTAVAQAKPTTAAVGQTVTFDGSQSVDDRDAASALKFEWDFTGDGRYDAVGATTRHAYDKAGRYTARLRVTDSAGLSSVGEVTINVTAAGGCDSPGACPAPSRPRPLPATGGAGGLAVLAVITAGVAAFVVRRLGRV
ncbi:MAG TPA: PKD domain-containing protein [Mycobacteriales bacterium]|nr:PKD domain-containing protein [Mycobacteriales bacterium]